MQLTHVSIKTAITKLIESSLEAVFVEEITDDDGQACSDTSVEQSLDGFFQIRIFARGRQLF